MRYGLLLLATLLTPVGANSAFAHYCEGGQTTCCPGRRRTNGSSLCGIAATHPWGPNGCQLCDTRNMYPNPFAERHGGPQSHVYRELR